MRNFVDLHTHSTASDGSFPPAEVVRLADSRRLAAVALADHDTIAGLKAAKVAASRLPKLSFIGAVEISAKFPHGTLHILGLGIDESCGELTDTLESLRDARNDRNPRIIAALQALGMDVTMKDVLAAAGLTEADARSKKRIIGRLHIAQTLRRKGMVASCDEAFRKYIGDGGPAFVDKERLSPRQAITAIRAAGGVAVLAHPVHLHCRNRAQLEQALRNLIDAGLEGIEAYHSDHTPAQTRAYLALAKRYDLLATGGSDFHGQAKPDVRLGRPRVPLTAITSSRFAQKLLG